MREPSEDLNNLSRAIIAAAIEVHRILGPGLLENVYRVALMQELSLRGINAESEVDIPIQYKGVILSKAYRADIIVDDKIIVELKATLDDNPLFRKQLLTYLRLSGGEVGLLINFNKERLVEGVKRIVNTPQENQFVKTN